MSIINRILSQLKKVKKAGTDRWMACCPAHDDKSPSLSIMQNETGKVNVHCFAGCGGEEILRAIGMSLADLYPDRIDPPKGLGKAAPFNPYDVLAGLASEAMIVAMLGSELADHPLSPEDRKRLFLAVSRIRAAIKLAGVTYG